MKSQLPDVSTCTTTWFMDVAHVFFSPAYEFLESTWFCKCNGFCRVIPSESYSVLIGHGAGAECQAWSVCGKRRGHSAFTSSMLLVLWAQEMFTALETCIAFDWAPLFDDLVLTRCGGQSYHVEVFKVDMGSLGFVCKRLVTFVVFLRPERL